MPKPSQLFAATFALLLTAGLAGCTLYPEKKPPTLATTTSAEQYERIYWQAVQKQNWQQVTALQAPSVIYATRKGELVDGVRWITLLQSSPISEYLIGEVHVRPQGNEMILNYVVQTASENNKTAVPLAVVSVWQQTKSGYMLISHTETPRLDGAS